MFPTFLVAPDVNMTADNLAGAIFQRNAARVVTSYQLRPSDGQRRVAAKFL
jgi:hypothetical protein